MACQKCKGRITLPQETQKDMFTACPLCGVEWLDDETEEYKSPNSSWDLFGALAALRRDGSFP